MMFFGHTLAFTVISVAWFSRLVLANTEIRNFRATAAVNVPVLQALDLLTITPANGSHVRLDGAAAALGKDVSSVCSLVTSTGCEHQIVVRLLLPDAEAAYTLRISWPGSSPADFFMDIIDPASAAPFLVADPSPSGPQTSTKYAFIRIVDTGIVPFSVNKDTPPVPFILTLEPLALGILPSSLAPLVGFYFLPLLVGISFVIPSLSGRIGKLAVLVRRERRDAEWKSE
ncbi:hypothetical protein DL96DRAFT_1609251 [Flagelloscypha sp. PMI_526]|nr:hypothetical protein DL96DRAFT_1609251 [Flagelloscypha sp. PMI_526]